jgi:hypothetical protein
MEKQLLEQTLQQVLEHPPPPAAPSGTASSDESRPAAPGSPPASPAQPDAAAAAGISAQVLPLPPYFAHPSHPPSIDNFMCMHPFFGTHLPVSQHGHCMCMHVSLFQRTGMQAVLSMHGCFVGQSIMSKPAGCSF